jgi:hypothetical protein
MVLGIVCALDNLQQSNSEIFGRKVRAVVALGALSGFFALERRAQNDGKGEASTKDKQVKARTSKSEMRGFFASLRMTNSFTNDEQTVYEMTNGFE